MPRQPRRVLPGTAMHVIQRGNNRAACFRGRSDYLVYLLHLHELTRKFDCAVHAYCLMPNHVHLLLTPSHEQGLTFMRDLGQRYLQYFNRRHGRTGTLWEGRFRSSLTQSARYVLAGYRYIELTRCGPSFAAVPKTMMVEPPRQCRAAKRSLVSPHAEFSAFGADTASRRSAYLELFRQTLEPLLLDEIRAAVNAGYPSPVRASSSKSSPRRHGSWSRDAPGAGRKPRQINRALTPIS